MTSTAPCSKTSLKSHRENMRSPVAMGVVVCGDIWEYVIVLRENRLFDEHRIVGFERFRQPLGHRFGHTTVKVDADVDVRTDVFPNAP